MRKGRGGGETGKKDKKKSLMEIGATTSLPGGDRLNADRWNAARSQQITTFHQHYFGVYHEPTLTCTYIVFTTFYQKLLIPNHFVLYVGFYLIQSIDMSLTSIFPNWKWPALTLSHIDIFTKSYYSYPNKVCNRFLSHPNSKSAWKWEKCFLSHNLAPNYWEIPRSV